jgi:sigma-E factor negative regulatory protein RseA
MSDILNEQLSALLDGELPPEETALLMRRLEREPELRTRLARYGLCGGALRGERLQVRRDFALRVSAVVAGEPALAAPAPRRRARRRLPTSTARRWLTSLSGIGVAAAVAGLAVFVLQRSPAFDTGNPAVARVDVPQPVVALAGGVPARAGRPAAAFPGIAASVEPATYVTPAAPRGLAVISNAELASYFVAHSEFSAPLTRRSVLTDLIVDGPVADLPAAVVNPR